MAGSSLKEYTKPPWLHGTHSVTAPSARVGLALLLLLLLLSAALVVAVGGAS